MYLRVTDKRGAASGTLVWHNKASPGPAYHLWSQRRTTAVCGKSPHKSPGRLWRNLYTVDKKEKVRFPRRTRDFVESSGQPLAKTDSTMKLCQWMPCPASATQQQPDLVSSVRQNWGENLICAIKMIWCRAQSKTVKWNDLGCCLTVILILGW